MGQGSSADRKPAPDDSERLELVRSYRKTRAATERLTRHLQPGDMVLQAMPDASPVRWHLAHVTWFFEEFVLKAHEPGFAPYNDQYAFLFNSYYESIGARWARVDRGLLSRPTVEEIIDYRHAVDERIEALIDSLPGRDFADLWQIVTLGINHEQQHQELLCTDLKAAFGLNPVFPVAFPLDDLDRAQDEAAGAPANERWVGFSGGLHEVGHSGEGFHFDNEAPRHKVWLEDYALHGTPVTAGQFLDFIADGGYRNPALWLSDGWDWVQREGVAHPLYWHEIDGAWFEFTLHGLIPVNPDRIVTHISAYEAFAFAAWANARLPTEAELERALVDADPEAAQWLDPDGFVHPRLAGRDHKLGSAYGSVWDWTQSAYTAYPGFRAAAGAIGEYNGKFMSSQLVLKGGSCATPPGHIRATYRNFFPPSARWQFTGLRLARDAA